MDGDMWLRDRTTHTAYTPSEHARALIARAGVSRETLMTSALALWDAREYCTLHALLCHTASRLVEPFARTLVLRTSAAEANEALRWLRFVGGPTWRERLAHVHAVPANTDVPLVLAVASE